MARSHGPGGMEASVQEKARFSLEGEGRRSIELGLLPSGQAPSSPTERGPARL